MSNMIEQSQDTTNIEVKIKDGKYVYWFGLADSYRRHMPNGHWIEHPDIEIKQMKVDSFWRYGHWHLSCQKVDTSLFTINLSEHTKTVYTLIDMEALKDQHPLFDISQLNDLPDVIRGKSAHKRLMAELGIHYADYDWHPFNPYESERIHKTVSNPVIGQWKTLDFDIDIAECDPNFDYRVSMPDAILWGEEFHWAMPCVFLNTSENYTKYLEERLREITKHKWYVWQYRPNSNYSNELSINFPSPTGSYTFRIPHGMKADSLSELIKKLRTWEDETFAHIQQIEQDGCFSIEQIEAWIKSYGLDRVSVARQMRAWLENNGTL